MTALDAADGLSGMGTQDAIHARRGACGNDECIGCERQDVFGFHIRAESNLHTQAIDLGFKPREDVSHGVTRVRLGRNAQRAAEVGRCFSERDAVASKRRHACGLHPCRSAADDEHVLA